jgi:2-dehydropantoate 2-reductase
MPASKKSIVIFGAGAIGGSIAAYMTRSGEELTVIDPWYAHILKIQRDGLHVTDPDGEFIVRMRALHHDQVKELGRPIDILFLAVKSYDTEWATRYLSPYLSKDGYIVSAQNSLNEEIISPVVGSQKTMGMVVTISAAVYAPGDLLRNSAMSDRLAFQVGELDGKETPRLRELADLMSKAGQTRTTSDIWSALWTKLCGNCMANSLAGLTGLTGAGLAKVPEARKIQMLIVKEVVEVGEAHGIKFTSVAGVPVENFKKLRQGGIEVIEAAMLKSSEARTGIRDNRPSLLQDVIKGRRTEADYLNGLIVRKGREEEVPAPVNAAVTDALHRLEAGELKQSPSNLDLFKKFIW